MNIEKAMESSRRELSLRPDFCIRDVFKLLDTSKRGKLNFIDFKEMFKVLKVRVSDFNKIRTLFDLYDLDTDGLLSYAEFSQFVCPRHKDYWKLLRGREPRDGSTLTNFERVRKNQNFQILTIF